MTMTPEAIEQTLKKLTDRLDKLDPLVKGKKHLYFRCGHSGLFFPADYLHEWGRKYGKGLGEHPVSECWDTMYNIFPTVTRNMPLKSVKMHPVKSSCASLDAFFLSNKIASDQLVICEKDDPLGERRVPLIYAKQKANPNNKLKLARDVARQEGIEA